MDEFLIKNTTKVESKQIFRGPTNFANQVTPNFECFFDFHDTFSKNHLVSRVVSYDIHDLSYHIT